MKLRYLMHGVIIITCLLLILTNAATHVSWKTLIIEQSDIQARGGDPNAISLIEDSVDIFPLGHNFKYSYLYFSDWEYYEMTIPIEGGVDSGLIQYLINDSIRTSDSTVTWDVQEVSILKHWEWNGYSGQDTTYWTFDTVALSLIENTNNYHELLCSGIIWKFPLKPSPTQSLYRYADSTYVTIIRSWGSDPFSYRGCDTLRMNDSAGFYYRGMAEGIGSIRNGQRGRMQINLLQKDVLDVMENWNEFSGFTIQQNYPNPFNPSTQITYSVPKATVVTLKIYDLLGREVALLVNERKPAGEYTVNWNAVGIPTGIYFYRLTAGEFIETKKMAVVK